MKARLDLSDIALLAAFALVAVLGTWTRCLLVNDGAFLLSVGWLGDAWDLYFKQIAGRGVSTLLAFGPAWAARSALGLSSDAYIVVAHVLYFAVFLGLWLAIRWVEPSRLFSRLYLATMLAVVYFPTETLVGVGLWMIWAALVADPARSRAAAFAATVCFAPVLAFTHPVTASMSLIYLAAGGALVALGRPFPRQILLPTAAMTVLLIAAYVATRALLPASNPTIGALNETAKFDYIDPLWMLGTFTVYPMLAVLWLLLLAPGVENAGLHWRRLPIAVTVIGLLGLWFAANGTSLLTYLFARHSATHVLALAVTLAAAGPAADWLARARQPLAWFAAIIAVAGISYNIDLFLFGRFIDQRLTPGVTNVDRLPPAAGQPQRKPTSANDNIYFKWAAGSDYVRDVVAPNYQRYPHALAFYSFFRSNRRSVLFHEIPGRFWMPFECPAVDRALAHARDDLDRQFLTFLRENYCVP
jgi:hypothetical protein